MMLSVQDLCVRSGALTIVDGVCFDVAENQWLMVVGPNGAGKSTIINAISGGVASGGDILFEGQNLKTMKPLQRARMVGVLAQNHNVAYSFSVGEVVRLGRYSYAPGIFSSRDQGADQAVANALEVTGMRPMEHQNVLTLSGGELQRTFLAQALAQDPRLLILDEPANHLDLVYQKQVFTMVAEWARQPGRAVISVVHDLSLVRRYGTHALLLHKGKCVAKGDAGAVLTRENLKDVYSIDVYDWMDEMLAQWKE